MRAMVLESQGPIEGRPLRLRDVPIPEPGAGEVRVRVGCCAICRTDLHVVEGDLPQPNLPLIPGHQAVGVVDALGEGCRRLKLSDRVGIAWLRGTDGTCRFCLRGRENLCLDARFTGYHENGGYAEYALVREDFAYPIPEAFDDAHAAPLLCAGLIGYRALRRAALPEKGRLLLIGFGSSAHIVIQLAIHRGHRVSVVSRGDKHRELCLRLGAAWAGSDFEGLPEKVDGAILFAPVGDFVPPAMRCLDRGGILSIAGIHLTDVPPLNYERELFYEREVRSVTANTREDGRELFAEALAAGIRPEITPYPLEEANQALLDMKEDRIAGTGVLTV